ncbi:hypothetical protein M378DRAFT_180660 [Amanita muscaria Koide BX008]|uniref:DUF6532 domain-containing protein n=1 Tax=Amanita muscaria (strain Koide BX008) TaxID=946122 RepID=A0A0C2SAP9_AMAMK|nr:hypothetical protein M378DRAFT_180660 [Amanita muscaria Koide BX008]
MSQRQKKVNKEDDSDSEYDGKDDDTSSASPSEETSSSDEKPLCDDLGSVVGRALAAANERFAKEQPIWSDQLPHGTVNGQQSALFSESTDEEKPDMTQQGKKSLIIRGQVINISDDDEATDNDDSPTSRLVLRSTQVMQQSQQETLQASTVNPSQPQTFGDNQATNLSVVTASGSNEMATIWPAYTNLLRGQRDVALNVQSYELKLIVRRAMDLVEERIRFQNAFPTLVTRTVWNRSALVEACALLGTTAHIARMRERYEIFKERMRVDSEYIGEISKALLDPRISILRGDTKLAAINNTRLAYGLRDGCAQKVQELLTGARYIYPIGANGPFENIAVIGTLRDDLFLKNISIVTKFPLRFRVEDQDSETDSHKLSPAMIALAATAVFAALKEWELGHRVQTHFTANLFDSIYRTHIKHLEKIQALNETGHPENPQAEEFNLTDVQNMSTDI